jgi:hypothetical protein
MLYVRNVNAYNAFPFLLLSSPFRRAIPRLFHPEALRPLGCRVVTLTAFNMYNTIRKNLKIVIRFLAKQETTFLKIS